MAQQDNDITQQEDDGTQQDNDITQQEDDGTAR